MNKPKLIRAASARSLIVALLLAVSGCSMIMPAPQQPDVVVVPDPEPAPEPTPEPERPIVRPLPPPPPPLPPPTPQNVAPLVAVILSDRTPAYVDVVDALDRYLEHYDVYDFSDRSLQPRDAFARIAESGAVAVVAIGMPAAQAAQRYATTPVVIGQVFNLHSSGILSEDIKAVASLPPIAKQIDAWRELDPTVRNVGAIVGEGHDALIEYTDALMRERGIKFHYGIARSDRETLYLFNRLIRDVDGYLLFPDNRVLSRQVLDQMMNDAARHRVQVAVFNEPLLDIGATFSGSSIPTDIAAHITLVLNRIVDGEMDTVPPVTELSEIRIRTNPEVLRRYGLTQAADPAGDTMADAQ